MGETLAKESKMQVYGYSKLIYIWGENAKNPASNETGFLLRS